MKKDIDYLIADPEGNITILVLSPVDRRDYQRVARDLLDKHPEAEQVGYAVSPYTGDGMRAFPAMEMCGLEFCGNATRAFSLYEATRQEPPLEELDVLVSGCAHPLHAWIETDPEKPDPKSGNILSGIVRIEMPLPEEMEDLQISVTEDLADQFGIKGENSRERLLEGRLIHLDGISHLVVSSVSYEKIRQAPQSVTECLFLHLRDSVYQLTARDLPAFGVMFFDRESSRMTPIVYVRDVDTIYFEGSCASGTAAAACAAALWESGSGEYSYTFRQPRGTLHADVSREGNEISGLLLYGGVKLSGILRIETEVTE